ncbi:phage tail protein, partial [Salmonella enterica]
MHRIDTPTAQKDKFGQGKNGFTNGDPATGRRATDLNSDMWDAVQEEVCTVIEAAGIPLSKGEHTQLHAAIGRLIDEQVKTRLEKNQNGADIPNKPLFLQNVGLTETVEQARNAVPSTRKVNGKALTTDITLTSGDVGALPITGGQLNGPLGIGTDNALGGNSIVFGDNDTGFKWHSDGVLGIYANNA